MNYTARVVISDKEISEEEIAVRVKKFQEAFVMAAVEYYSNKIEGNNDIAIAKN